MSSEAVATAVHELSAGQKHHLLTKHFVPPERYSFPLRQFGKKQRAFQSRYLRDYAWMVYSPEVDGAFCKHCALMLTSDNRSSKGFFVNKPFVNFQKIDKKAKDHQSTQYHQDSLIAAESFVQSVLNPEQNINNRYDEEKKQNIRRNRHIIACVADAVLYCGRQCIGLRGHREELDNDSSNVGNFLAALQMLAKHDQLLNEHLNSTGLNNRNAKYTSPRIQNEIIEIIAKDMILSNLIKEVQSATFFSVLADEVTSHNKEELALCVRFVDGNSDVREEFLSFLQLPRITGEAIANKIIDTLEELELDITKVRGQGYDGAANMSSDTVGVQRRIKNQSPNAVYVHCSSHTLNLVISHSCALPNIRNAVDKLKQCSLFFLGSPKREGK